MTRQNSKWPYAIVNLDATGVAKCLRDKSMTVAEAADALLRLGALLRGLGCSMPDGPNPAPIQGHGWPLAASRGFRAATRPEGDRGPVWRS